MRTALKWMLAPWLVMCWLVSGSAHATAPLSAACFPKVQWPLAATTGSVPASASTRFDTYAAWVCNLPTGYKLEAWLFKFTDVTTVALNYARGIWTKAQADADCANVCVDPTAAELTFINQLITVNKPAAKVAFNGSNAKRSVYAANADGTLNPAPIVGSSVAVAAACDSSKRIVGTTYYSVQGLTDATKGGALGDLFAVCVVTLPIGAN